MVIYQNVKLIVNKLNRTHFILASLLSLLAQGGLIDTHNLSFVQIL